MQLDIPGVSLKYYSAVLFAYCILQLLLLLLLVAFHMAKNMADHCFLLSVISDSNTEVRTQYFLSFYFFSYLVLLSKKN